MPATYENIGDFSTALNHLKAGHVVARSGWNGKNMWLKLQTPDANSKMSLPYVYMCTATGDLVPWLASQTDLLASDWMIVDFDINEGDDTPQPDGYGEGSDPTDAGEA